MQSGLRWEGGKGTVSYFIFHVVARRVFFPTPMGQSPHRWGLLRREEQERSSQRHMFIAAQIYTQRPKPLITFAAWTAQLRSSHANGGYARSPYQHQYIPRRPKRAPIID